MTARHDVEHPELLATFSVAQPVRDLSEPGFPVDGEAVERQLVRAVALAANDQGMTPAIPERRGQAWRTVKSIHPHM